MTEKFNTHLDDSPEYLAAMLGSGEKFHVEVTAKFNQTTLTSDASLELLTVKNKNLKSNLIEFLSEKELDAIKIRCFSILVNELMHKIEKRALNTNFGPNISSTKNSNNGINGPDPCAQQPNPPVVGQLKVSAASGQTEVFDGNAWLAIIARDDSWDVQKEVDSNDNWLL